MRRCFNALEGGPGGPPFFETFSWCSFLLQYLAVHFVQTCEKKGWRNIMSPVNLQAFMALGFFLLALLISRAVVRIGEGKWPGGQGTILFLRILLGFVFAGAIYFAFYAFAGIDILNR